MSIKKLISKIIFALIFGTFPMSFWILAPKLIRIFACQSHYGLFVCPQKIQSGIIFVCYIAGCAIGLTIPIALLIVIDTIAEFVESRNYRRR